MVLNKTDCLGVKATVMSCGFPSLLVPLSWLGDFWWSKNHLKGTVEVLGTLPAQRLPPDSCNSETQEMKHLGS